MTIRAAVYLRISSDRTGEELGVTRQQDDCMALCAAKGWEPVSYTDNDISAASGKLRPAYEQMLTDIAAGRINAVVAWDLDRLHRRPIELEHFMTLADAHNIALATVSGEVDLSTPQGRLVARLKGSVASHEIEQLRMRCRRKWQQVALEGASKWAAVVPFGYLKDGTPDPTTGPLVTRAYRDILSGASTADIAREWTAAGITGARGAPWTGNLLAEFLRNPRNAGIRTHRRETLRYPDGHPEAGRRVKGQWTPLVDPAVWDAAMIVLTDPTRGFGRTSARRWLFTGTMRCGKCLEGTLTGGQQTGRTHPGSQYAGDDTLAYVCKKCFGTFIRHGDIEPVIKELIARRLSAPDALGLLKIDPTDEQESAARRQERNTLTARLASLADDYAAGNLDGPQARRATDTIKAKLSALDSSERDHAKVRAFADLPLGTDQVAKALEALSPDRYRAVMALLMDVVIEPVGRGVRNRPERIKVTWHQ